MNCSFSDLGLTDALVRAVTEEGYSIPTPIQTQAIPPILAGRDVLAGAQTGTGKTAGFVLPLLQRLATRAAASPARPSVRGLILTPTRELAAQVEHSVTAYGRYSGLRSSVIYGGVGMTPQTKALRRGVDILVATPGRLLDHVQQRSVDLSGVQILILDEADRMLDMGFVHDIRRIIQQLPPKRQTLLFSATFSSEIRKLADGLLHSPVAIEIARRQVDAELVTQHVHFVAQSQKQHALAHLLHRENLDRVLVFSRTKHGTDRLAAQLNRDGINAAAIHGNKSQHQRMQALREFKQSRVQVLVATDIAARGLDIDALPHVVNFDLPHAPEDYVHRIGRTGRAGKEGKATSLVSPEERPLLSAIERLLKRRLECVPLDRFREVVNVPNVGEEPRTPKSSASHRQHPQRGHTRPDDASQVSAGRRNAKPSHRMTPNGGNGVLVAKPAFVPRRPKQQGATLLGDRRLRTQQSTRRGSAIDVEWSPE